MHTCDGDRRVLEGMAGFMDPPRTRPMVPEWVQEPMSGFRFSIFETGPSWMVSSSRVRELAHSKTDDPLLPIVFCGPVASYTRPNAESRTCNSQAHGHVHMGRNTASCQCQSTGSAEEDGQSSRKTPKKTRIHFLFPRESDPTAHTHATLAIRVTLKTTNGLSISRSIYILPQPTFSSTRPFLLSLSLSRSSQSPRQSPPNLDTLVGFHCV